MWQKLFSYARPALILFILLSIVTGILYPMLVTGIGHLAYPAPSNGSLISQNGKLIGSSLIGQPFTDNKYFWSRPSATTPYPYNAANSSASNLGPSNPILLATVKARINQLRQADPNAKMPVPVGLVTTSGSGLDPDIGPAAAYYQIPRIAKARNLSIDRISQLVTDNITPRQFGILGEPRINVLKLNLALDQLK